MPIPNELSAEEEAMFAAGGVNPNAPIEGVATEVAAVEAADPNAAPVDPNAPADPNAAPVDPNAPADPNAAPRPQMVPHAALHAERLKAAEAVRLAQTATSRMNAILAQRREEAAARRPDMPDLEVDPGLYIERLEERLASFEQQRVEESQHRQTDQALESDEQAFTSYTPDYPNASSYYVRSRAQELLQFHAPDEAQRIMVAEARQIALQSWQRGIPAAQSIYALAQARGYQTGTGGQPPVIPATLQPGQPGRPAAAAVVDSVRRGQAASHSLSSGTGATAAETLNAEAILAMSDEKFAEYMKIGQKGADERFASIAGR